MIVIPVIDRILLTTIEPVAGPVITGFVAPVFWLPATVPLDATGVAAVTPTATPEVALPALLVAATWKS
jgi:hypothetical protein